MRQMMRWPVLWIALALVYLMLAACGSQTGGTGGTSGAAARATATSTPATPTPSPTSPPIPQATATAVSCTTSRFMPTQVTIVGGLAVSQQAPLGRLTNPEGRLPDTVPQQPFVLVQGRDGFQPTPDFAHPTNPRFLALGGGYIISLCNTSSTAHTIQRLDTRLESIAPFTGQLNEWEVCHDGVYSRQSGVNSGGCGGADFENEYMLAPFSATAAAGTVVQATQQGTNTYSELSGYKTYGPLPVTLKPDEGITLEVAVGDVNAAVGHVFATPGDYVFSFGVAVDGQAPVFASVSPPTLLAPPAHEWGGQACTSAAMQAQIPQATNPPTFYICPSS